VIHDGRPVLLDHILASRALSRRCESVEIFNDDLVDELTAQAPVIGSLHAPIVARFTA